jgi:hypothetical protein
MDKFDVLLSRIKTVCIIVFFLAAIWAVVRAPHELSSATTSSATKLNQTLDATTNTLKTTTTTIQTLNSTLETINRPCGAKDSNGLALAPGTLCDVNKAVEKISDVTVATQQQVQLTGKLVNSASTTMQSVATDFHSEMEVAENTTKSVGDLADQGTTDLKTADTTLAAIQPPLNSFNTLELHLDALFQNPAILTTMTNVATMTTTGTHMLTTLDLVENKITKCTLYPNFWCVFKSDALFGAQITGYILR